MHDRVVRLPPESHDFVLNRVESGRYENVRELMLAAFRALHREEQASDGVHAASSIAEGDVFRKLWEASAPFLPVNRNRPTSTVCQPATSFPERRA
jgi:Arc/MetJ-type ribon-helix-helix transcriptional regulator